MLGRFHQQPTVADPHSVWVSACMLSLAVHGVMLMVIESIDPPDRQSIIRTGATEKVEYFDIFVQDNAIQSGGPPPESGAPAPARSETIRSFERRAGTSVEGPVVTSAAEQPFSTADSDTPHGDLDAIPGAGSTYSEFTTPRSPFQARTYDPRLRIGGSLPALRGTGTDDSVDRLKAAILAVPDSMAAQSQREATMGLSRRYGQLLYNGKLIMPTDGSLWQTTQMMTYAEAAVRDSIRAERVRITREHADGARSQQRSQP